MAYSPSKSSSSVVLPYPDTRETPAIDVCKCLMAEKAGISIYDPKVSREQIYSDLGKDSMEKIQIEEDLYIACAGAHAIAILTEWDEFKTVLTLPLAPALT